MEEETFRKRLVDFVEDIQYHNDNNWTHADNEKLADFAESELHKQAEAIIGDIPNNAKLEPGPLVAPSLVPLKNMLTNKYLNASGRI